MCSLLSCNPYRLNSLFSTSQHSVKGLPLLGGLGWDFLMGKNERKKMDWGKLWLKTLVWSSWAEVQKQLFSKGTGNGKGKAGEHCKNGCWALCIAPQRGTTALPVPSQWARFCRYWQQCPDIPTWPWKPRESQILREHRNRNIERWFFSQVSSQGMNQSWRNY